MNLRILLADDDALLCECLTDLIPWEELGCELVGCASDGVMAYDMAIALLPDVVITDIKMPLMDGTDLCKKIREKSKSIKIIFLSAYEDFETAKIAIKYDVQDYILKPVDKEKIDAICEILKADFEEKKNKLWIDLFLHSYNNKIIEEKFACCDKEYFNDIFAHIKSGNISLEYARLIYNKIIDVMCAYFSKIGVNKNILNNSREKNRKIAESCSNASEFLEKIESIIGNLMTVGEQWRESSGDDLIDKITDVIERRFYEKGFSISVVAEELHYSADYLSRVFRENMQVSLMSYISDKKMTAAKRMLAESDLPVKSVSEKSGFMSCDYFIKAFKKSTGNTPVEYRQKIRNANAKLSREEE